jgi:hypothetical protein
MLDISLSIFILATLVAAVSCYCLWLQLRITKADLSVTQDHLKHRDFYLDYLLRRFELNVRNPYVPRPRLVSLTRGKPTIHDTERRCFHCDYPESVHQHHPDCPWVRCLDYTTTHYFSDGSRNESA